MPSPPIIAAIDFSLESERAAVLAVDRAKRADATLVLAYVDPAPDMLAGIVGEPFFFPPQVLERLNGAHHRECAAKLQELAAKLRAASPGLVVDEQLRWGDASDGIVALARDQGAGLIVMATRGSGATQFLLGSVSAHVAQRAPCPVLIADRRETPTATCRFRAVLCGIDESAYALPVAELGARFTEPDGIVELAHVWHTPLLAWLRPHPERDAIEAGIERSAFSRLQDMCKALEPRHGHFSTWVGSGSTAAALLARAETAGSDLVVLGAHGRRGTERALGTVTDRVLRYATTAVLVLPEPALSNSLN